jgi:flagellar protein FlgJ
MVEGIRHFVDKLRPAAEAAARAAGLPVEYLLAQAGLESGWGRHQPKDAQNGTSHNVFGIKAGPAWQGKVVEAPTQEVVDGASVPTRARFRAYDSYASSFGDFAKLLRGSKRYAPALAQAADPAAYAKALQRGGYATDPAYAAKLTRAIASVSSYVRTSAPADVQVPPGAADNKDVRT